MAALGGTFRLCLESVAASPVYTPVRVILIIDQSYTMCSNPPDSTGVCCTPGDSTGNCMMNDPDDIRIQAAQMFVDSLAARSPGSQVGVIAFGQSVSRVIQRSPVNLGTAENITKVKAWIDEASCRAEPILPAPFESPSGDATLPAPAAGLGKAVRNSSSSISRAVEAGLSIADYNYDALPAGMPRHLVMITDGPWDDQRPDFLIGEYTVQYPDRTFPKLHCIALSNTELHLAHNYPAEGCSSNGPVSFDTLELVAEMTGGSFFKAAMPLYVINHLHTLLDIVTGAAAPLVTVLTVTNATTGKSSSSSTTRQIENSTVWETTLPNLPLAFGVNSLAFYYTIRKSGGSDSSVTIRQTVVRSQGYRDAAAGDYFKKQCGQTLADITIAVSPESIVKKQSFDVTAAITDVSGFMLDTIEVRIFTGFPDYAAGALATFHLDGNCDNAGGGTAGAGTPSYTTTDPLFGSAAMSAGSLTWPLPRLDDAFVIEAWVKPSVTTAAVLFSCGGVEIGVTPEMKLYFKNGADMVTTALFILDDNAWSHIAVARASGKVTLFSNGGAASYPVDFTAPVGGDAITVSAPGGWTVDDVRFSNVNRITSDTAAPTLAVPSTDITAWNIAGTASTGSVIRIAPSAWKGDTALAFTAACPAAGFVLVNIRQKGAGATGTAWSKNSNPVFSGVVAVERPFGQPAITPDYDLPYRAGTYFNLLGKKVDNARHGGASRNRLPNGIYLNDTKEKTRQQRNVIVK